MTIYHSIIYKIEFCATFRHSRGQCLFLNRYNQQITVFFVEQYVYIYITSFAPHPITYQGTAYCHLVVN